MSYRSITPHELCGLVASGASVDLIDVRTPAEFGELHVSFARNMPLERLDPAALLASRNGSDQPLYVICRSGNRSRQACEKLFKAGGDRVVNVEGGTIACEQAGLPMTRGRKAISLERQVRTLAGLMVATGALLALLVHPWWAGLSLFFGCGLIFAGVTDTCPMAMALARMPWNQTGGRAAAGACRVNPGA